MSIFLSKKGKAKPKNDDRMTAKKERCKSSGGKKCANPVFEEWIAEWREDAIAKDLQSKHTYSKCLNSLKKYPLPLNSGKECIILEGFGDKICKLIDDNLERFLRDGGVLHPADDDDDDEPQESDKSQSEHEILIENDSDSDDGQQILAAIDTNKRDQIASKYSQLHFNKKNANKKNETSKSKKSSKSEHTQSSSTQSKRSNKEYLPGFRSGPYALLVALYNNEQDNGLNSFMLKRPLMEEAQKHCDSSFMLNDPNSRYTAWNSMSTLIKKECVLKENKLPARYSLTDSGRKLAYRLLYGVVDDEPNEQLNERSKDDHCDNICLIDTDEDQDKATRPIYGNHAQTDLKTNDNDDGDDDDDDDLIEILSDSNDEMASSVKPKPSPVKRPIIELSDDTEGLPDLQLASDPKRDHCPNYDDYDDYYAGNSIMDSQSSLAEALGSRLTTSSQSSSKASSFKRQKSNNNNNQLGVVVVEKEDDKTQYQKPKVTQTFLPDSYEIILYVDNCEQSHAKRQELLMDELRKARIKFDSGKLSVGDFAWIARSTSSSPKNDIILDFIVERKRMDDFCASILDGRYKEQKFRLKKCGIQNLIYLIEDFGSMKHMSLPEKSLIQADVNTHLIDGLVVHHSSDPKDTASYLAEMTHYVIKFYGQATLHATTKDQLDEYNSRNRNPPNGRRCFFLTLNEFNQFSNKNKPLTVREMFAKCLMKVQGVSQEKALAILGLYPTPAILFRELSKYGDESSRVKLIANLRYGPQQRNIGPAIGKLISQLFFTNSALN